MVLLSADNLSLHFGIDEIFNNISFQVKDDARIGLVGSNGAGKTSLLKIVSHLMPKSGGSITYKKGLKINYLSQISDFTCEKTVFNQVMSVFDDIYALEIKLRETERLMADADSDTLEKLADEYELLNMQFNEADGYAIERQARSVLSGLNIPEEMFERQVSTLSGGQRARIALASALLSRPDLLLLDEPTNHLDMSAISFLENYLNASSTAYIVVSHDRYFLDKVCGQIFEISLGTLTQYTGSYSDYVVKRDERYEQMMKEYNANRDLIKREEAIIARYRKWGREKSFKAAKSREKRLEKIERVDKPLKEHTVNFKFQTAKRSGDDVLVCENIAKKFGSKQIFSNIDLHINSGEKIGIIGENGIGKTTLLKIITKELAPSEGSFFLGSGVAIGYYDQHQQNLSLDKTAIDEVWDAYRELTHQQVRDTLALFLFRGDDIEKEISSLSGGERARLSLLKLMLSKANFLILDEPTNHLDMDSREVLEAALYDFPGTILFVSHDRYFINNIATRIVHMEKDNLTSYPGNWDDYLAHLAMMRRDEENADSKSKTQRSKEFKQMRESEKERKQNAKAIKDIEAEIEKLEAKIENVQLRLSDAANLSSDEISALSIEHAELANALEAKVEQWAQMSS
ncbi:MAG: ABC-F family ATP-binding cassette domain-containing protein [Clostridia bacterium]|nr:ABC-F family ATP-binding cassette domain-containing protein [Clostridia bacterium]